MKTKKIAVIGAGINGLACGVTLLEAGYSVEIFANNFTPNTTSSVAGALWMQFKALPWNAVSRWLKHSFETYQILEKDPASGVNVLPYKEYYPTRVEQPCWLADANHPYQPIPLENIPSNYKSGFAANIHRLDSTLLLPYLQNKFTELGGKFHQRYFTNLHSVESEHPIIINCTGTGADGLEKDTSAYPIRGQCLITEKVPGLNTIYLCFLNDENYVAIVPRKNDCWLGGTAHPKNWDAKIHQETTRFILEQAAILVPAIEKVKLLDVKIGFRSGRESVRLEKEILADGRIVIHNYGHGGSGFALSFGCAQDVVLMLNSL